MEPNTPSRGTVHGARDPLAVSFVELVLGISILMVASAITFRILSPVLPPVVDSSPPASPDDSGWASRWSLAPSVASGPQPVLVRGEEVEASGHTLSRRLQPAAAATAAAPSRSAPPSPTPPGTDPELRYWGAGSLVPGEPRQAIIEVAGGGTWSGSPGQMIEGTPYRLLRIDSTNAYVEVDRPDRPAAPSVVLTFTPALDGPPVAAVVTSPEPGPSPGPSPSPTPGPTPTPAPTPSASCSCSGPPCPPGPPPLGGPSGQPRQGGCGPRQQGGGGFGPPPQGPPPQGPPPHGPPPQGGSCGRGR